MFSKECRRTRSRATCWKGHGSVCGRAWGLARMCNDDTEASHEAGIRWRRELLLHVTIVLAGLAEGDEMQSADDGGPSCLSSLLEAETRHDAGLPRQT